MRRRYDNPSEASSILSALPLSSRASSRTAIVTPQEDFRTSRYTKPDISPELTLAPSSVVGSSKSSAGSSINTDNLFGPRANKSRDAEPYGPYFSIPLKANSKPALSRRGTTKELIGRYESLSTEGVRSGRRKHSPSPSVAGQHIAEPQIEEKRGKGRSPIRQSFRNLLSVFGKRGKTAREASLHVSDLLEESEEYRSPGSKYEDASPSVPTRSLPTLQVPTEGAHYLDPAACTTPIALHSGRLHYLCNPVLPDGLPVWIDCDVTLHSTHLVVTWRSNSGNPSSSLVHLPQCTDVRSLNVTDLDPVEASLLPAGADAGEWKIFELLFEGRAREKFAVSSVKERAGWVSAVW